MNRRPAAFRQPFPRKRGSEAILPVLPRRGLYRKPTSVATPPRHGPHYRPTGFGQPFPRKRGSEAVLPTVYRSPSIKRLAPRQGGGGNDRKIRRKSPSSSSGHDGDHTSVRIPSPHDQRRTVVLPRSDNFSLGRGGQEPYYRYCLGEAFTGNPHPSRHRHDMGHTIVLRGSDNLSLEGGGQKPYYRHSIRERV